MQHWVEPAPLGNAQRAGPMKALYQPLPEPSPELMRKITAEEQRIREGLASSHTTFAIGGLIFSGLMFGLGWYFGKKSAKKSVRRAIRAAFDDEDEED